MFFSHSLLRPVLLTGLGLTLLSPWMLAANCAPNLEPVAPEVVDLAVNDDLNDPLGALLDAPFASAELYGTKNADGELETLESIVVRSKRTGRVYSGEFDGQGRVITFADDLGNLFIYDYGVTDVRIDYVSQDGESGNFSVPNATLPAKLRNVDAEKPRDNVAQTLIVPDTVGIATTVTLNGVAVDSAYVTASIDYGNFRLGGYFYRDGDYANRYFTAFVNRRAPYTARFDKCVEKAAGMNKVLTVAGAALFFALKVCQVTAFVTPPGQACVAAEVGLLTVVEAGIVSGSLATAFPEYACAGQLIPADPAVATVTVDVRLPTGVTDSETRTVNLHAMPHPRLLNFIFNFDTQSAGNCAPNTTFDVFTFNNDIWGSDSLSVICISGTTETPTISWDDQLLPHVRQILIYDESFEEWTWEIKVPRVFDGPPGRIEPPVAYGQRSDDWEEIRLPLPIVPGHRYRVELHTADGIPDIVFIPR